MAYRDELEAALARIATLERELAERGDLQVSLQIARQDAEANLQIATAPRAAYSATANARQGRA